jgi:hypothetical protein
LVEDVDHDRAVRMALLELTSAVEAGDLRVQITDTAAL